MREPIVSLGKSRKRKKKEGNGWEEIVEEENEGTQMMESIVSPGRSRKRKKEEGNGGPIILGNGGEEIVEE